MLTTTLDFSTSPDIRCFAMGDDIPPHFDLFQLGSIGPKRLTLFVNFVLGRQNDAHGTDV